MEGRQPLEPTHNSLHAKTGHSHTPAEILLYSRKLLSQQCRGKLLEKCKRTVGLSLFPQDNGQGLCCVKPIPSSQGEGQKRDCSIYPWTSDFSVAYLVWLFFCFTGPIARLVSPACRPKRRQWAGGQWIQWRDAKQKQADRAW